MWFLVATSIFSAASAVHVWTRNARVARKLVWTAVVAVPVIGPLAYAGMYQQPKALMGADRANERSIVDDALGARH